MTIEKVEHLASVEILFPSRAIQAAWHTYITEGGEVISGPSIRRRAYVADELGEILPEIQEVISADYVQLLAQAGQVALSLQAAQAQLEAQAAQLQTAESRVIELEAQLQQQATERPG